MAYESIHLEDELCIDEIFTVHYFEYRSDFHFPGERHDFWEFQYVDKGSASVTTDTQTHILTRGEIIFHSPNEFHDLMAAGQSAPNIVVVSFACTSPCMSFFKNRMFHITDGERNLMGLLVAEARRCIASPLNDPYMEKMEKRPDCMFGAQQLVRMYLQEILISLIRRHTLPPLSSSLTSGLCSSAKSSAIHDKILFYLEEHIQEHLTVEAICHDNLIGRSQLQKLFREHHGCGVIEFFSQMKTELAKQLIRENRMNFTQISDFLGYSSIHYFSRQFKKISGMTPTEYVNSIQSHSRRSN